ncbi:cystatin-1-like [Haemaphysalis longicornis]
MALLKTTAFGLLLISIALTGKAFGASRRWERVEQKSHDMYERLAYFALGSRSTGRFHEILLRIVDVQKKVGPGTSYRIEFMTSKTKCRVSKMKFEKWLCPPKSKTPSNHCIAVIYTSPGATFRRLDSFLCHH